MIETNPELQLAADFIHYTDKNVFLTGEAGTGKTTFLHTLKSTLRKRMAIVAPTGVAAINAGGVTIHSFFQLPLGPIIPEVTFKQPGFQKFSKEKINLLKSLDVLVIDEISMVRADVLDGIDAVLRRYRDRNKPFGGVQLLMIGDLYQLSPVIREDEWGLLRQYYDTGFFFGSHALKKTNPVRVVLTKIYRQSDAGFIKLLNKIRENRPDAQDLEALNQRYIKGFRPGDEEGFITLTTHNSRGLKINKDRLEEIQESEWVFKAVVTGDFPPASYPTEQELVLKVGTQVMFIRNDTTGAKRFYNGKIGRVSGIGPAEIYVTCKGETDVIVVQKIVWENIRYQLNPGSKEISAEIIGTFEQFPLRLAWAITIHKSQGLTFEKVIIDASASFAHGQVYVALSRCKTLEGVVLSTPVYLESVITDAVVEAYTEEGKKHPPDSRQLWEAKRDFQQTLLFELFDFNEIGDHYTRLLRVLEENKSVISRPDPERVAAICSRLNKEIGEVAGKFRVQLTALLAGKMLPEENAAVQERVRKAAGYFSGKIAEFLVPETRQLKTETDNKGLRKTIDTLLEKLKWAVGVKRECMHAVEKGFSASDYIHTRANADIDLTMAANTENRMAVRGDSSLYAALKFWREAVAAEHEVPDYMVLPVKTIRELVNRLPGTLPELATVPGIGKAKISRFGTELLTIIREYCEQKGIAGRASEKAAPEPAPKKVKIDVRRASLEQFKSGKSIEDIARERGNAPATIENHLLHFIGTSELSIYELYPGDQLPPAIRFLSENQQMTVSDAKAALGDSVSYSQIKAIRKYLQAGEV